MHHPTDRITHTTQPLLHQSWITGWNETVSGASYMYSVLKEWLLEVIYFTSYLVSCVLGFGCRFFGEGCLLCFTLFGF